MIQKKLIAKMFLCLAFVNSTISTASIETIQEPLHATSRLALEDDLRDVIGAYEGEIRLQSSDGNIDRLLKSRALLKLDFSGDEIRLKTNSNLSGNRCQSQTSSVRELFKYPPGQAQIIRAEFDLFFQDCPKPTKPQSIVVLVGKDDLGVITLETLLLEHSQKSSSNFDEKRLHVHGYFISKKL